MALKCGSYISPPWAPRYRSRSRCNFASSTIARSPISGGVEPIIARQQALRPQRAHREVASEPERAAHMVDPSLGQGLALHAARARDAIARIAGERRLDIVGLAEPPRQRARVLDR